MAADLARPGALRLPRFSSSVVIRRTCRVWITSLHLLLIIGAVFLAPTFALLWFLRDTASAEDLGRVAGIGTLLFSFLMQGAVVSLVFQKLLGQRPQVLASIGAGFKRVFSVLGIALVMGLVAMASMVGGSILVVTLAAIATPLSALGVLVIALLLVTCILAWCVAIPAAVVEQLSPMLALRRSARLTKGSRLRIFGALFVLTLISYAGEMAIALPVSMLTTSLGLAASAWLAVAILPLVTSFFSVWPTVLYHELRETKEGIGLEQLASVFQ